MARRAEHVAGICDEVNDGLSGGKTGRQNPTQEDLFGEELPPRRRTQMKLLITCGHCCRKEHRNVTAARLEERSRRARDNQIPKRKMPRTRTMDGKIKRSAELNKRICGISYQDTYRNSHTFAKACQSKPKR
eukprot:gene33027-40759_t